MTTELAIMDSLEQLNPAVIFSSGGIESTIDKIREQISSEVPDISTAKGRKRIISQAAKVSASKKILDDMGKALADKLNAELKPINAERKIARDQLDILRDQTRRPVTEWEQEQERIAAEELAKADAEKLAAQVENDHEMGLLLNANIDREAAEAKAEADAKLAEEQERQRIAAEQAIKDREQAAADKVRKEAEAEAKFKEEKDAFYKALTRYQSDHEIALLINNKMIADKEAIDAQEAAEVATKQAEANRIAEAEKAESDRVKAAQQAAIDRQAAVQAEKDLQAANIARDKAETAKREANRANVSKVRKAAKEALMAECGVDEATARKIVLAISNKKIPAVSISY